MGTLPTHKPSSLGQAFHLLATAPADLLPPGKDREALLASILADPGGTAKKAGVPLLLDTEGPTEPASCPINRTMRCQEKPDLDLLPLEDYSKVIIGFSGGKDSVACALTLYERLVAVGLDPRERMELWHHGVDGGPDDPKVWDWPCTDDYCRGVAAYLGVPLLYQYRKGGINRELWRTDECAQPVVYQTWGEGGELVWVDLEGKTACQDRHRNTRHQYPQVTANLQTRWCTSSAKIEVGEKALVNDPRFTGRTYLFVTGERRQESNNRARYSSVEEHRSNTVNREMWKRIHALTVKGTGLTVQQGDARVSDLLYEYTAEPRCLGTWLFASKRKAEAARSRIHDLAGSGVLTELTSYWVRIDSWVFNRISTGKSLRKAKRGQSRANRYADHHRPVLDWIEKHIWSIIRRWGIVPHPCYWLGFSRASCETCIFLTDTDLASLREVDLARFAYHVQQERRTGKTIHRLHDLTTRADRGSSFAPPLDTPSRETWEHWRTWALNPSYGGPVYVHPDEWTHPPGAFRHSSGPD